MAEQWYYSADGTQQGPISGSQLKQLAASGDLQRSDLIWKEGMADWVRADKVRGLFGEKTVPALPSRPKPKPKPVEDEYGFANVDESDFPAEAEEVPAPRKPKRSGREYQGEMAGFGRRLGAFLIDQIALLMIGLLLGLVVGFSMGANGADPKVIQGTAQVLGYLVGWIYYAAMESSASQATPEKQAMGIKVTDLSGRPISFGHASLRHFSKVLSALPLLAGFLAVLVTPKKQGFHDMVTGCLVIKSND
jgi:uncharacterized RDD family membrane protein YckC